MSRGGDFYAVWDESRGLWSTEQDDVIDIIDTAMDTYRKNHVADNPILTNAKIMYLWNADTGSIDKWHKYVQKQMVDNYHALNETLIFQNSVPRREDYASFRLPYALEPGYYSA